MKKQILILAGSALILASCGSNNNNNQQNTQAQMDSISKANAALQDEINRKKNDSTINAMAAAKADSIEKASHATATHEEHKEHKGGKTHEQAAPPVTQAPPPATVGNGKPSMKDQGQQNTGQKQNTVGNGKPSMK